MKINIFKFLKINNGQFDYFKSQVYLHSKETIQNIIGEHLVGVFGTCMAAAANIYFKKNVYFDNNDLFERNKILLLNKKRGKL